MLFNLIVFILVLGLLVFFHEMGHFLAAKACGTYCDRFSLGMPPRLFGVKIGETDYCVGALPIGGYVKMAGQEDVPKSEEERKTEYGHVPPNRWLSNKPIWQRAIVFAAGPLMNSVLAVLLYGIVAAVGEEVSETKVDNRIGYVVPDSPAAFAPLYRVSSAGSVDYTAKPDAVGWRTGDRILSINKEPVACIADVAIDAALSAGKTLEVEIERIGPDAAPARFRSPVEPRVLGEGRHPRFGVEPFITALVGDVLDGMPAQVRGLQRGDIITHANGNLVDVRTFSGVVEKLTNGEPLELRVQRGSDILTLGLQPRTIGRFKGIIFAPPLHTKDLEALQAKPVVAAVTAEAGEDAMDRDSAGDAGKRSSAASASSSGAPELHPMDVILEADGRPATVGLLNELSLNSSGKTVALKVRRPAVLYGLLRRESIETLNLELAPRGVVGIEWDEKRVFHRVPPSQVASAALRQSKQALERTMRTLGMLLTGGLSITDLGGPVMIFRATTEAARMGYSWLLEITAFISINLCVFNLLPLPILDGGHLVLLGIEAIRRKPVSIRVAEIVQQVGMILIIGLVLFITYNDIKSWLITMIP